MLSAWCVVDAVVKAAGTGYSVVAPGLIFDPSNDDPSNDVAPDVVGVSKSRLAEGLNADGHLIVAPDLVVEVISPGSRNEQRDREFKLKLYSRQGVREYWIVDCLLRHVQVYRRCEHALQLMATLMDADSLASPMLTNYSLPVAALWWPPVVTE
jgi:Uma2 family endonuclease